MSFETDQVILLCFLSKLIFELLAGEAEWDVHDRTSFRCGVAAIEATAVVDRVIDQSGFLLVGLLNRSQTTDFLCPLEDESNNVDREGGRRVVQGSTGGERLVIKHYRQVGGSALDHVVAFDHNN